MEDIRADMISRYVVIEASPKATQFLKQPSGAPEQSLKSSETPIKSCSYIECEVPGTSSSRAKQYKNEGTDYAHCTASRKKAANISGSKRRSSQNEGSKAMKRGKRSKDAAENKKQPSRIRK